MGNNGGTAFVRINGKRIYLGKFGSPEAKQNYARCVAEWAITANNDPGQPTPAIGSITIDSLCIAFLDHAQRNAPTHYHSCRYAVKILLQLYSGSTVESFSPKCLAAVQHQFTQYVGTRKKRYSRQYCNTLVKHIKQMFRWGVIEPAQKLGIYTLWINTKNLVLEDYDIRPDNRRVSTAGKQAHQHRLAPTGRNYPTL